MLCAGLSGAVCLCACMCECVSVCVRARARVSGSRCPRSPPLFWWSDSCEKPPLVAPSALAVSNFLSHCRLNVTSALELEFYPIVRRQPSPQRHRELPEKQDSAIFIEAEKGEKKASFIWKGGWQVHVPGLQCAKPNRGASAKELERVQSNRASHALRAQERRRAVQCLAHSSTNLKEKWIRFIHYNK